MNDDEVSKMLGKLDQMCKAAGADTPTGSRYAMLHQQLQNYQKAESREQKQALAIFMRNTRDELQQIERDGGQYIPEHHIPRGSA